MYTLHQKKPKTKIPPESLIKLEIIIVIIRAVIQTVGSASLKQGIPNFILLALSEEQSQLVATERQCFP